MFDDNFHRTLLRRLWWTLLGRMAPEAGRESVCFSEGLPSRVCCSSILPEVCIVTDASRTIWSIVDARVDGDWNVLGFGFEVTRLCLFF